MTGPPSRANEGPTMVGRLGPPSAVVAGRWASLNISHRQVHRTFPRSSGSIVAISLREMSPGTFARAIRHRTMKADLVSDSAMRLSQEREGYFASPFATPSPPRSASQSFQSAIRNPPSAIYPPVHFGSLLKSNWQQPRSSTWLFSARWEVNSAASE